MTDGRPEARPPSREHYRQVCPLPISTASTQNVKRSAHRTNTSNEGDKPAPTGPFDYPITLKTTLL